MRPRQFTEVALTSQHIRLRRFALHERVQPALVGRLPPFERRKPRRAMSDNTPRHHTGQRTSPRRANSRPADCRKTVALATIRSRTATGLWPKRSRRLGVAAIAVASGGEARCGAPRPAGRLYAMEQRPSTSRLRPFAWFLVLRLRTRFESCCSRSIRTAPRGRSAGMLKSVDGPSGRVSCTSSDRSWSGKPNCPSGLRSPCDALGDWAPPPPRGCPGPEIEDITLSPAPAVRVH